MADRVGDQPRTLVPDLLLSFGLDTELAGVDVGDRPAQAVVRLATVQGLLDTLAQADIVDELEDVERAAQVIKFPQSLLRLVLAGVNC